MSDLKTLMVRLGIVFFLVIHFSSFAQDDTIDSLQNILKNEDFRDPAQKVDLLLDISNRLFYTSSDEAIRLGLQALELSREHGDKILIAQSAKHVGSLYYKQSDFGKALEYFNIALKNNLESNNIGQLAASYNNLGVVFNRLGYYEQALEKHLQQLKINEETKNLKGIAISNRNIGNIYNNMGENTHALEYYFRAMKISEQLNDTNSVATALINLGVASTELHSYNQAIEYFNEALVIKQRLDDKINIGVIYSGLGVAYSSQNDFQKAIGYFEESLAVSEQINHRHNMVIAMINLGDIYRKQENYSKSFDYLNGALLIAQEIDANQAIRDVYESLSSWYEATKDYKQSLEYYQMMTVLKDSLLNLETSKQIRNLQIVYEVEKKEKENFEQRISIARLKERQFYLLLVIVVALAMGFVIYYRYRSKKKLNRDLEARIAEALLKEKEQQQIIVHQASLTSLGELAAGIAHEIKQPLQNISLVNEGLQIESAENKDGTMDNAFIASSARDIAEGIKRIKFIVSEINNFSRGQQEHIMKWFNVNTRIENAFSLARTKFSNRRIDVKFDLDPNIPEVQGNPYKFEQVIVNFFNNAKDAIEEKAELQQSTFEKTMIVRSYINNNFINVEVEDNGKGVPESCKTKIFLPFFTTKALGKGTGLGLSISLGIAKEMGGFIEIESEEMKGTLMRLKIPVTNSPD